jgi:hypothetical protein
MRVYYIDTMTIKRTTKDQWGESSSTSSTTVDCFVKYRTRLVRDTRGNEVVSSGEVILDDTTLYHSDVLEIEGKDYTIANIFKMRDFDTTYLKVFLR